MTESTDAELEALFVEETGFAIDDFPAAITIDFARAVLAKWGTPPAVAGEPVATIKSWTNGSYWRNYKVEWHRNDLPKGAQLYTTPQPTQAEAITPPPIECNTEELKKAYAFGWWSALEKQRETAQAGAVPLTDERIIELAGLAPDRKVCASTCMAAKFDKKPCECYPTSASRSEVVVIARAIEAHHGIKGGQHGTE